MDFILNRTDILNKDNKIVAYEVSYFVPDEKKKVDDNIIKKIEIMNMIQGIKNLVSTEMCFLKIDSLFFLEELPFKFEPDNVVVVIDKKIQPNNEILNVLLKLKENNYNVMIEDFIINPIHEPFVEYANFLRLNAKKNGLNEIKKTYEPLLDKQLFYFVDNIKSFDDFFVLSRNNDFNFYKGDFLFKQSFLNESKISCFDKIMFIYSVKENNQELIKLIRQHVYPVEIFLKFVYLTDKKPINQEEKIKDVTQVFNLMPQEDVARWLMITSLRYSVSKSFETYRVALQRAYFCEMLAKKLKKNSFMFFCAGLFSLFDVLLDIPIDYILNELPIAELIKEILYSDANINDISELAVAYENGDWKTVDFYTTNLKISYRDVFISFKEAVIWSKEYLEILTFVEKDHKE